MENIENNQESIFISSSLESVGRVYSMLSSGRNIFKKSEIEWDTVNEKTSNNFPFIFDMTELIPGRDDKINISALTVLLSYSYYLKNRFKYPIPLQIEFNEFANSFLNHVNFFKLSNENKIFSFDEILKEGNNKKYSFNPATIILEEKKIDINYEDLNELYSIKGNLYSTLREDIEKKFYHLFLDRDSQLISQDYISSLYNLTAELASNSILHGKSPVFLCVQRIESWKRGTLTFKISVCDTGIGFLESFKNSQKWAADIGLKDEFDAILNACLMEKQYKPGLKEVIEETINQYNGTVTINSNNSEIHWGFENWNEANENFNLKEYRNKLQRVNNVISNNIIYPSFPKIQDHQKGFYRNIKNYIKGTRIFFELNFDI